jgi:hypothetical protein
LSSASDEKRFSTCRYQRAAQYRWYSEKRKQEKSDEPPNIPFFSPNGVLLAFEADK